MGLMAGLPWCAGGRGGLAAHLLMQKAYGEDEPEGLDGGGGEGPSPQEGEAMGSRRLALLSHLQQLLLTAAGAPFLHYGPQPPIVCYPPTGLWRSFAMGAPWGGRPLALLSTMGRSLAIGVPQVGRPLDFGGRHSGPAVQGTGDGLVRLQRMGAASFACSAWAALYAGNPHPENRRQTPPHTGGEGGSGRLCPKARSPLLIHPPPTNGFRSCRQPNWLGPG